jgi:outer membrane lipase/esterase
LLAGLLAACGGGGSDTGGNNQSAGGGSVTPSNSGSSSDNGGASVITKVKFNSLVSFGDSLSDVGTYAVGTVKALGGGKFTINSPQTRIWIELLAAQMGQKAPCAAQTGLEGSPVKELNVTAANHPGCTAYAQGGARITEPKPDGQLSIPVVAQIRNHLQAAGGSFKGDEVVFVMAGGNDVFAQMAVVNGGGSQSAAVAAMDTAGAELVSYVNNLLLAKGAKYVVTVNLPDVSRTPMGIASEAAKTGAQAGIDTMVRTFNARLKQGLGSNPNVIYVDAYALTHDQLTNPVQYGLTNVTGVACDLASNKNPLGSSLVCTPANLVPGVVDRYEFADSVHPTPYAHQLLAAYIASEMAKQGWL